MADFTDFRKKDFLEQITLLRQAEAEKDVSAIPVLFELHASPLGDQSVDLAVINVLQSLLVHGEAQTVAGLAATSPALRRLCLRTVGRYGFASALPVLMDMAARAAHDPDDLQEVLSALSRLRAPESLPLFRAHLDHPDPFISALCAEMLGLLGDARSLPRLAALVDAAEVISGDDCPITVFKAVEALAAIGGKTALTYLAKKMHHHNPTARRAIHEALVHAGKAAIPFVAERFHGGDLDERLLSANILGFIGHKSGADTLVAAQDRHPIDHPNLRFAVYEALGRAPSLKGLVFLLDGLSETDPVLLLAVITALEANANPGVVRTIAEMLEAGGPQAGRIARAMAEATATDLFVAVGQTPDLVGLIIDEVARCGDPDILEAFARVLSAQGTEEAAAHAARLRARRAGAAPDAARRRVLAVDDSKAMLAFYKSVLPGLGFSTVTAENGQDAWDILDGSDCFDLIVADMNMPVMDGIELTRLVRGDMAHADTPILMATTESAGEQVELAQRAGVTGFLKKPFTVEALRSELSRILP
ncbi:MAG: HEAT repeat domain-containing protein [Thermodesulfobacteriota bacterium]